MYILSTQILIHPLIYMQFLCFLDSHINYLTALSASDRQEIRYRFIYLIQRQTRYVPLRSHGFIVLWAITAMDKISWIRYLNQSCFHSGNKTDFYYVCSDVSHQSLQVNNSVLSVVITWGANIVWKNKSIRQMHHGIGLRVWPLRYIADLHHMR